VAERVGFLGAVPHEDLPALYCAADVMALPSASEGLANAWVEALACGTPIAISDVGGARANC
jgi:teichuronic acid biosynthesis glycosyltransferase TuaC